MIRSFRHKGLRQLFEDGNPRGVDPAFAPKLRAQLAMLNYAAAPEDMDAPGNRLHPLKGDRKGAWSVTVSRNFRLVFEFDGADAINVNLIDYHGS